MSVSDGMDVKFSRYDTASYLKDEDDIAAYLDAVMEDGDPALIAAVLGDVARARNLSQLARDDMDKGRDAPAHNAWFTTQVQAAIDDPRPSIPHHVIMAEVQALIDRKRTEGKGAHGREKTKSR